MTAVVDDQVERALLKPQRCEERGVCLATDNNASVGRPGYVGARRINVNADDLVWAEKRIPDVQRRAGVHADFKNSFRRVANQFHVPPAVEVARALVTTVPVCNYVKRGRPRGYAGIRHAYG